MREDQVDISILHLIFGDSLSRNLELGTSAKARKFQRPVYLLTPSAGATGTMCMRVLRPWTQFLVPVQHSQLSRPK